MCPIAEIPSEMNSIVYLGIPCHVGADCLSDYKEWEFISNQKSCGLHGDILTLGILSQLRGKGDYHFVFNL